MKYYTGKLFFIRGPAAVEKPRVEPEYVPETRLIQEFKDAGFRHKFDHFENGFPEGLFYVIGLQAQCYRILFPRVQISF